MPTQKTEWQLKFNSGSDLRSDWRTGAPPRVTQEGKKERERRRKIEELRLQLQIEREMFADDD